MNSPRFLLDANLSPETAEYLRSLGYVKQEIKRPIVIPMYKQVPVFIIKNNLRSAGITRKDYFRLLKL